MNLILMRHAERKHNVPEQSASLSKIGIRKTGETAAQLRDGSIGLDCVLSSEQGPAIETAKLLTEESPDKRHSLEILNPGQYSPKWSTILQQLPLAAPSVQLNDQSTIVLVGHHPGITNLLTAITSHKSRRIGRGEAILVKGSLKDIARGRGNVAQTFGTESTPESLRKKVELKMTVCTFLAGFTIPVLVELVKGTPQELLEIWRILPIIAFTFSLALFVAAVFAFDLLLMPNEYWGAINPESRPKHDQQSQFARDYRLNGALYAYMVRTWTWFFEGGLAFILLGFFALLCKHSFGERLLPGYRWSMSILSGGALLAIIVVFVLYRCLRPRLGIVD